MGGGSIFKPKRPSRKVSSMSTCEEPPEAHNRQKNTEMHPLRDQTLLRESKNSHGLA
jgi:hypothetical protein